MDMTSFNERIPLLLKHFNECGYCDTWHSTLKAECQRLLLSLKDYDTVDDYITAVQKSSCNGKKEEISIVQIKTHRELRLKLLPCYGNLIYNYILNQRPKAKSRLIFLRTSNSQLNTHDTYRSTIKVLHAAGIDITNRTRGIHLLRHSLATSLIVRNTNLAVVTATLGHKSARATFTYLSSEVEGLRKCCLSSESFPINENYFSL